MKARIVTIGACSPMATTTKPSVAARLYAGAVEATPMTMLEIRPSAPAFKPFSGAPCAGSTTIEATSPPFYELCAGIFANTAVRACFIPPGCGHDSWSTRSRATGQGFER